MISDAFSASCKNRPSCCGSALSGGRPSEIARDGAPGEPTVLCTSRSADGRYTHHNASASCIETELRKTVHDGFLPSPGHRAAVKSGSRALGGELSRLVV